MNAVHSELTLPATQVPESDRALADRAMGKVLQLEKARQEVKLAADLRGYEKRRKWTRTDSARWLNERSPEILAWLRRKPGAWPAEARQVGYWMKIYAQRHFDRAHARLLAGRDEASREAMLPGEVIK